MADETIGLNDLVRLDSQMVTNAVQALDKITKGGKELESVLKGIAGISDNAIKSKLSAITQLNTETQNATAKTTEQKNALIENTKEIERNGKELTQFRDTQKAVVDVTQKYRKEIDLLDKSLRKEIEDYLKLDKTLDSNKKKQAALSKSIKDTTIVLGRLNREQKGATTQLKAAEGSYRDLELRQRALLKTIKQFPGGLRSTNREVKGLIAQYGAAQKKLLNFDRALGINTRNLGNYKSALNGVRTSLLSFGSALGLTSGVFLFAQAIREAFDTLRDFDKSITNLAAIIKKPREEIKSLENEIRRVAKTSVNSANEVADLATALVTLGKSQKEIERLLEPVNNLSIGLNAAADEAGELLVGTLNAFGEGTDSAQEYADVIAKIRLSTALDFEKIKVALGFLAPTANAARVSIQKTGAILGVLADNQIPASRSGRLLSSSFLRLAKSGKTLDDALIQLNKVQQSTTDELVLLREAGNLFGTESAALGLILASNIDKVDRYTESFKNASGSLDQLTNDQLKSLDAQLKILNSTWTEFILSIENGEGVIGSFISNSISEFVDLINSIKNLDTAFERFSTNVSDLSKDAFNDLLENSRLANGISVGSLFDSFKGKDFQEIKGNLTELRAEFIKNIVDQDKAVSAGERSFFAFNGNIENASQLFDRWFSDLSKANGTAEALAESLLKGVANKDIPNIIEEQNNKLSENVKLLNQAKENSESLIGKSPLGDRSNLLLSGLEKQGSKLREVIRLLEEEYKGLDDTITDIENNDPAFVPVKIKLDELDEKEILKSYEQGTKSGEEFKKAFLEALKADRPDNDPFGIDGLLEPNIDEESAQTRLDNIENFERMSAERRLAILEKLQADTLESESLSEKERFDRFQDLERRKDKIKDELHKKDIERRQQVAQIAETTGNIANTASDTFFNNESVRIDNQIRQLEESRDVDLAGAEGNADAKAAIERNFQQERKKLLREQAENDKKAAIQQAQISLIVAVAKAIASAPFPVNLPAILSATAEGGAQVVAAKKIKIPKFYKGFDRLGNEGVKDSFAGRDSKLIRADKDERMFGVNQSNKINKAYGRVASNEEVVTDLLNFKNGNVYDLLSRQNRSFDLNQELNTKLKEGQAKRESIIIQASRPEPFDYDRLAKTMLSHMPDIHQTIFDKDGNVTIKKKTGNLTKTIGTYKMNPNKDQIKENRKALNVLGFNDEFLT